MITQITLSLLVWHTSGSYLCSGGSLMACFGSSCEDQVLLPPGVHIEIAYGSGFLAGPMSCEDNPYWGLRHLLEFLVPQADYSCRCPQGKCNVITLNNCWDVILDLNDHASDGFSSYVPPDGPSISPVISEPSRAPFTSPPSTSGPTLRPSFDPSHFPTSTKPTLQPTNPPSSTSPSKEPVSSYPTQIPTTLSPTRDPAAIICTFLRADFSDETSILNGWYRWFESDDFFLHTGSTAIIQYCDDDTFFETWVWTENRFSPCESHALAVTEGTADHNTLSLWDPLVYDQSWSVDRNAILHCGDENMCDLLHVDLSDDSSILNGRYVWSESMELFYNHENDVIIKYCEDSDPLGVAWLWTRDLNSPCESDPIAMSPGVDLHVAVMDVVPLIRSPNGGWTPDTDAIIECRSADGVPAMIARLTPDPSNVPTTTAPLTTTSEPTYFPITTAQPTLFPTTVEPSHFPTSTAEPTNAPTTAEPPSYAPSSDSPTALPTSSEPTREPSTSLTPTHFPSTAEPSDSPVVITGICENPSWELVEESDCPEQQIRTEMRDCQSPESMAIGQLCEADAPIPGFPQANTINNCGHEDVFRLVSCAESEDLGSCLDDDEGLFAASYGLLSSCDPALSCDTILNSAMGTTIADFCAGTCGNCNCRAGEIFVNANLPYPAIENGEIVTLMCPQGYLGNVQLKCEHASPIVHYGTCVLDLTASTRADPLISPSAKPVEIPTSQPSAVVSQVVSLQSAEESIDQGIHPVFLYVACVTSGLLVILCLINCGILMRNGGYPFESKAEDEKRPHIISIAPEYIHQHEADDLVVPGSPPVNGGREGEPGLLDVDELPDESFEEFEEPRISVRRESASPVPVAAEISVPTAISNVKCENSSRSVSLSRPWWTKSRSRPRMGSQFSLASSIKSNIASHKRVASQQFSDVSLTSAHSSRSRVRHPSGGRARSNSNGLYLNDRQLSSRVRFAPTPSPMDVRDNCMFLPPLKENDEEEESDPSELSSEDDFAEEKGLYVSSVRKPLNFSPSQSMEGRPTPSRSMLGRQSTSCSEEGSTTATSYIVGSKSPSMSFPGPRPAVQFDGKKFERARRVVSRAALARRANVPDFFNRNFRVSV